MTSTPFFSVVLTTYGRGEHIRPTIESVLRQTYSDFELIVVGDGCTDATEEVVRSFGSRPVSWYNLEQNSGSQSFPNNLGIKNAVGKWIAYLGHDDIWSPNHLAALRALAQSDNELDFAVSGCISYGPKDSEIYFITGLFDSDRAQFEHFFPPSSLAHRREIVDMIGWWRDPRTVAPPVDCDFLLRAAHAGLRFASTKEITVHKYVASQRYLSSLRPDSEEQWAGLEGTLRANPESMSEIIEKSRQQNRFMRLRYGDYSGFRNGQTFDRNRLNKGVSRPELTALKHRIVVEQTDEPRGYDWHGLRGGRHRSSRWSRALNWHGWESGSRPFRWSGPSPEPKILIPYTYRGEVRITLCVPAIAAGSLDSVRIAVNGRHVDYEMQRAKKGSHTLAFQTPLNESDYSILVIHTPEMASPKRGTRRRGIAISDIIIEPCSLNA